jgi:4-hydroxy-3-methylbut-2-enyl diphosphate reductase
VAELLGRKAYLIDRAENIDPAWLAGSPSIGVTAGASAPEVLVEEVIERLRALGAGKVQNLEGVIEDVKFPLPSGLR